MKDLIREKLKYAYRQQDKLREGIEAWTRRLLAAAGRVKRLRRSLSDCRRRIKLLDAEASEAAARRKAARNGIQP